MRGRDGDLRGFHNTCRHRGSRNLHPARASAARLVCPYHRWTYDLSGELAIAARMGDDFEPATTAWRRPRRDLRRRHLCLPRRRRRRLRRFRAALDRCWRPTGLRDAKLAHESTLVERGNWKLAMENARECYHCATSHPELALTFPTGVSGNFDYGEDSRQARRFNARMAAVGPRVGPDEGDWWQAIRFPLNEGCRSMTMDGQTAVRQADGRGGRRRYRLAALGDRAARLRPRHRRLPVHVQRHAAVAQARR